MNANVNQVISLICMYPSLRCPTWKPSTSGWRCAFFSCSPHCWSTRPLILFRGSTRSSSDWGRSSKNNSGRELWVRSQPLSPLGGCHLLFPAPSYARATRPSCMSRSSRGNAGGTDLWLIQNHRLILLSAECSQHTAASLWISGEGDKYKRQNRPNHL